MISEKQPRYLTRREFLGVFVRGALFLSQFPLLASTACSRPNGEQPSTNSPSKTEIPPDEAMAFSDWSLRYINLQESGQLSNESYLFVLRSQPPVGQETVLVFGEG